MINIRYHIFSLIAVFAALAIGLTIGTTVVRGPLVDNLRQNLDRVEARNETVRRQNDDLNTALKNALVLDSGGGALLVGRAQSTPVLIIEEQGASESASEGIRQAFTDAGAVVIGRLVIDSDAGALGESVASAVYILRSMIASATVANPVDTSQLLKQYMASVLAGGSAELKSPITTNFTTGVSLRLVVVADRNGDNADWTPFTDSLFAGLKTDVTGPLPVLIEIDDLDVTDDVDLDPSIVAMVRDDSKLRSLVSTVDNASHFPGWAAAVLAAESSVSRVATHLGVHDGSEGLLPSIR